MTPELVEMATDGRRLDFGAHMDRPHSVMMNRQVTALLDRTKRWPGSEDTIELLRTITGELEGGARGSHGGG